MSDVAFFIDLLENQPPYKTISISLNDYAELSECQIVKFESFCPTCGKERTFITANMTSFSHCLKEEIMKQTSTPKIVFVKNSSESQKGAAENYPVKFLGLSCNCAHCAEEHYFTIRIDGQSICKIGQYPSFSRKETLSLKKYKNLISKYYTELTKSVNLYSQGLGIGSFVYLRRILEHLVETKYYALPEHEETARFIDKLKAVQEVETIIPPELEEIKEQIYSVLSKGIHEYTEEECYALYDVVLYVVTAILDQELYKKEKASKIAEVKKIIIDKLKK